MAKARSPQYPSIGLKEAVEKIAAVYARDYQNTIPRQVVAEHMGYQSLNGKSLGVLSALIKYGLLEGRGDNSRVSDLAVQIIAHPPGTAERAEALKEAAEKPELFTELDGRFPAGRASDQAIRSYLLTQKFIPHAADAAIRSYRETKAFVEADSAGYTPQVEIPEANQMRAQNEPMSSKAVYPQTTGLGALEMAAASTPLPSATDEPFRLSITLGGGIEVVGRLRTVKDVDALVRHLNTWKILVTKLDDIPEVRDQGDEN